MTRERGPSGPSGSHCPICEDPAPPGAARCDCGYDFATRDASGALVRIGYARRRARELLRRGLATAFTAVIGLLAGTPLANHVEVVGFFFMSLALGAWWVARGALDAHAARRRLRAVATLRQLPAARVVHGLR
jgi:hypothetical protein